MSNTEIVAVLTLMGACAQLGRDTATGSPMVVRVFIGGRVYARRLTLIGDEWYLAAVAKDRGPSKRPDFSIRTQDIPLLNVTHLQQLYKRILEDRP